MFIRGFDRKIKDTLSLIPTTKHHPTTLVKMAPGDQGSLFTKQYIRSFQRDQWKYHVAYHSSGEHP